MQFSGNFLFSGVGRWGKEKLKISNCNLVCLFGLQVI